MSARALIARINRKLAQDGEQLKTLRGGRGLADLGRYYIVDVHRNLIIAQHCEPEELARELGCMAAWEELAD